MNSELHDTARSLVAPGKGILAADESGGTIKKRFDSIGVESTEENRRAYRELLFTTPGAEEFISGVILFDETIRQSAADGTPFPQLLDAQGNHPGNQGRQGRQAARARDGRDGHRGSRRAARALRGVPRSRRALREVARDLLDRRRAPERVLRVGERPRARALRGAGAGGGPRADRRARGADGRRPHDRGQRARRRDACSRRSTPSCTTSASISAGTLLKPNMVLSGYDVGAAQPGPTRSRSERSSASTATCPRRCPGSCSSRAARSDEDATIHLNAMNARGPHPWQLSFSYGRALQAPALKAWRGQAENAAAAQRALHRAKMNGAARSGELHAGARTRGRGRRLSGPAVAAALLGLARLTSPRCARSPLCARSRALVLRDA